MKEKQMKAKVEDRNSISMRFIQNSIGYDFKVDRAIA